VTASSFVFEVERVSSGSNGESRAERAGRYGTGVGSTRSLMAGRWAYRRGHLRSAVMELRD